MVEYFLAVDGGGTKTHVLCADPSGTVLGEGMSGPTSLAATSVGAASFNLLEAVRQATQTLPEPKQCKALVMGLAGLDTDAEALQANTVFKQSLAHLNIQNWSLVNDSLIALESGTSNPDAVVLISGTGSNCFGRNSQGQTAKAGGMDYLLTDQGSGYAIGRAVLRESVKSFDGRGRKTELEQYVCEHFHIASIAELKNKVSNPALTKTEVAELAQQCLRALDQGDAVAAAIFDHVVSDLSTMINAVLKRLSLLDKPVDVVLAGSITKISVVKEKLVSACLILNPQIKMVFPTKAPVHGALDLVLRQRS